MQHHILTNFGKGLVGLPAPSAELYDKGANYKANESIVALDNNVLTSMEAATVRIEVLLIDTSPFNSLAIADWIFSFSQVMLGVSKIYCGGKT